MLLLYVVNIKHTKEMKTKAKIDTSSHLRGVVGMDKDRLHGVDGLAGPSGQVGLPEGLRAGGVGVADSGNILTAGSILKGQDSLHTHRIAS